MIARILAGVLIGGSAQAQVQFRPHDGHARFHSTYRDWINGQDRGCCNDQDCAPLAAEDERERPAGIEVRIEGRWCPVKPFHYLKRGNAPDWSTSHVCVQKQQSWMTPKNPCDRLLCYQPKPGT